MPSLSCSRLFASHLQAVTAAECHKEGTAAAEVVTEVDQCVRMALVAMEAPAADTAVECRAQREDIRPADTAVAQEADTAAQGADMEVAVAVEAEATHQAATVVREADTVEAAEVMAADTEVAEAEAADTLADTPADLAKFHTKKTTSFSNFVKTPTTNSETRHKQANTISSS